MNGMNVDHLERAKAVVRTILRNAEAMEYAKGGGVLTAGEWDSLVELQKTAADDIAELFSQPQLRPQTAAQVERFRRRDQELAKVGYEAAERRKVLCKELGIGRSRYFELQRLEQLRR
jgi:hypothetical protein